MLHETRRWLIIVHQLPSEPSHVRVRTWRRLRQLGALNIKQAVYVLPDSAEARGHLHQLSFDILEAHGESTVFTAEGVDIATDAALVNAFRHSRQLAYGALARDVERTLRGLGGRRRTAGAGTRNLTEALGRLRRRFEAAERLDFFAAPGRDRVVSLLEQLSAKARSKQDRSPVTAVAEGHPKQYRDRVWVTRLRPGIDRLASAWLIRRFVDPNGRFSFVLDQREVPEGAIPFDMPHVEFSHQDGNCTFETLCHRFGIRDRAVKRIAEIVHDLDLKDERFGAPEAATIGGVIRGLQLTHAADDALLESGIELFEALYRSMHPSADAPIGTRSHRASN